MRRRRWAMWPTSTRWALLPATLCCMLCHAALCRSVLWHVGRDAHAAAAGAAGAAACNPPSLRLRFLSAPPCPVCCALNPVAACPPSQVHMNHSCSRCNVARYYARGQCRISFFTTRDVAPGEELLYE